MEYSRKEYSRKDTDIAKGHMDAQGEGWDVGRLGLTYIHNYV